MTLRHLFLALLLLFGGAGLAHAQTFPKLEGRVVDAANLLSPEQKAQLTQLSAQVEQASSRQFVIATIPDLEGYDISDYGYRLGRAWQIGQKEANNGIILIVAPKDRKVRIEVGYGLEPIMTDALSKQIIDDTILPKFRAGDMAGGIMAGADEIATQMKLPLEAAEQRAKDKAATVPSRKHKDGGVGIFIAIFWAIFFFAVIGRGIFGRGRRGRRYGGGSGLGQILLWSALNSASRGGGGWSGGGGWGGGGGGGGFSGGGGSFGGGGASGGW
ncbi:MAG: TPM domain-containing protein [Sphingomonas sp.]